FGITGKLLSPSTADEIWNECNELLAGVAERFSMLKYGLAVILVFIGIKMLIVDFYHIPIAVSLGVVFGILVMTFIINAWVNYRHDKQRGE
ncbi:hypothetical protein ACUOFC_09800, partial [Escherichia sp. TWPC-MK]